MLVSSVDKSKFRVRFCCSKGKTGGAVGCYPFYNTSLVRNTISFYTRYNGRLPPTGARSGRDRSKGGRTSGGGGDGGGSRGMPIAPRPRVVRSKCSKCCSSIHPSSRNQHQRNVSGRLVGGVSVVLMYLFTVVTLYIMLVCILWFRSKDYGDLPLLIWYGWGGVE